MTVTVQPRSLALLDEIDKNITTDKSEADDNNSLLLPLLDSLNKFYKALIRLDNAITRKKLEQSLYERENKN